MFREISNSVPNCNRIFIKFIIKLRNCNKVFSYMKMHKTSVTQNLKFFLLQVSEFSDTIIGIFNTFYLKIKKLFLKFTKK